MKTFQVYNPHPQQKLVGDCVKRALTKASGLEYKDISVALNRIKRDLGASSYASNSVWTKYLEETLNAEKVTYPAKKGSPRMNGHRFIESHPQGTYVLSMAGHLSCCVDGVIYDTWDCREKCVYASYEIPQKPKLMPMPGIEKLEALREEYCANTENADGEALINKYAQMVGAKVKYTKKNEPWISLDSKTHDTVIKSLLKVKHYRWETKAGSMKTVITDEETGMKLILKNGKNPYLWCVENGKS